MQRVSLSIKLEEIGSATSTDSLTEQVLSAFQIPEINPMGLSQQFDLKRELTRITLYVQGRWLCSLLLDITPPDFDSDACTKELEIRVCTEVLLERTRRERSSQFFAESTTWRCNRSCSKLQVALTALWAGCRSHVPTRRM